MGHWLCVLNMPTGFVFDVLIPVCCSGVGKSVV